MSNGVDFKKIALENRDLLNAALAREAALREELEHEKSNLRAFTHLAAVRLEMYETSQQRLTVAEQRESDLKKLLCDVINESPTGFAALKVDLAHRVNYALKPAEVGEGS